jgi:hypothetical protein
VGVIVTHEEVEALFPDGSIGLAVAFVGNGAVDQAGNAVAHMLLNAQVGEGGQAQMLTHGVGGSGQVGNGINQGAIQIEGNGFDVFQVHDLDW